MNKSLSSRWKDSLHSGLICPVLLSDVGKFRVTTLQPPPCLCPFQMPAGNRWRSSSLSQNSKLVFCTKIYIECWDSLLHRRPTRWHFIASEELLWLFYQPISSLGLMFICCHLEFSFTLQSQRQLSHVWLSDVSLRNVGSSSPRVSWGGSAQLLWSVFQVPSRRFISRNILNLVLCLLSSAACSVFHSDSRWMNCSHDIMEALKTNF